MTTNRPFALRLFVPSGFRKGMRIGESETGAAHRYVIPSLPPHGVHQGLRPVVLACTGVHV